MASKLLHGARGAADGVAGAAKHVAWLLSYCLDGSATRAVESGDARLGQSSGGRAT